MYMLSNHAGLIDRCPKTMWAETELSALLSRKECTRIGIHFRTCRCGILALRLGRYQRSDK